MKIKTTHVIRTWVADCAVFVIYDALEHILHTSRCSLVDEP